MCGGELFGPSYCDLLKPPGMGSRALFVREECLQCHRDVVEPCYPWVDVCSECDVKYWSPLVLAELPHSLEREPHNFLFTNILPFLVVNRIRSCRMYFLRNVLTSRNCVFRRFTYYGGGLNGTVSETEDLLDKIMSFL